MRAGLFCVIAAAVCAAADRPPATQTDDLACACLLERETPSPGDQSLEAISDPVQRAADGSGIWVPVMHCKKHSIEVSCHVRSGETPSQWGVCDMESCTIRGADAKPRVGENKCVSCMDKEGIAVSSPALSCCCGDDYQGTPGMQEAQLAYHTLASVPEHPFKHPEEEASRPLPAGAKEWPQVSNATLSEAQAWSEGHSDRVDNGLAKQMSKFAKERKDKKKRQEKFEAAEKKKEKEEQEQEQQAAEEEQRREEEAENGKTRGMDDQDEQDQQTVPQQ